MRHLQESLDRELTFFFKKPVAFLYRDFISDASYRFAFVAQFIGIFLSVMTFFFLSKLFGSAISPYLEPYGGDYFSFVLIGIAFANYLHVSLNSFSTCIRDAQILGTLEAILVTQTEIPATILCSSVYSFIMTSLRVIVFLLLGAFAFGIEMGKANVLGGLLILFITIVAFSSLGIISASFIMVLKKGNPINWIFSNLSWVLGGVFYPISVLPSWIQKLSYLLPITYSLEGMRLALLKGYSLEALLPNIIPLSIFAIIMLPLSIGIFQYGVKRAKIDGSLTQY